MTNSMTAYASASLDDELGQLSWEIRAVNHRFLDISMRLPDDFRALENSFREILAQHIRRGRLEAVLRFQPADDALAANLNVNETLAQSLLAAHAQLCDLLQVEAAPEPLTWLHWPGMIEHTTPDLQPLQEQAGTLLETALQQLSAQRQREGQHLAELLEQRLQAITELVLQVRAWLPEIRQQLQQRLLDRLAQLQLDTEPGRLEQELAMQAQKMDVDEELDRLDGHVKEARVTLQSSEPVGRRLDFLMQEFNREANTLGSKSIDPRTSQTAIDLKVLIEQLREQVQNIE
ncbi:MAG: YicC family protein [Gammaproteobacteria bacterium]|jgi:uncharacterized protein (TIGR00255 family)|nr:YicC family protein [Gammaproteobacteria bacterium]